MTLAEEAKLAEKIQKEMEQLEEQIYIELYD